VRIGELDGPAALTKVGGLLVIGDTLFLAQSTEGLIRRFTPGGRFLSTLGRRGEGPGEFRGVHAIALIDGNLVVLDRGNERITTFHSNGEVATRPISYPPSAWPIVYRGLASPTVAGRVVIWADVPVADTDTITRLPIVLADSVGTIVDTLAWYDTCVQTVCVRRANGGSSFASPLNDHRRQVVAIDGSMFVEVEGAESETVVRWTDLRTLDRDSLRFATDPVVVPRTIADSLAELYTGALGRVGNPLRPHEVRETLGVPRQLLGPARVFAGEAGVVWISEPEFEDPLRTWRRLTAGGQPVEYLLPRSLDVIGESPGMVWTLEVDEFGVHYIVGLPFQE
jgi:hypothetical protein